MEFLFLLITEISLFCGLVLFYKGMLWLVDKAYSDLKWLILYKLYVY